VTGNGGRGDQRWWSMVTAMDNAGGPPLTVAKVIKNGD
jgi:hypothetical protein